jgi:hypothetical protein
MKKPGVKPKGKRALTKAEQQQRVRARLRIINEEMDKIGLKPLSVHMPPIYLQAMRAYESGFQPNQNMIETVILSSGWICKIVEDFIKEEAERSPNSEVANIFNSPEWVNRSSIDFDLSARKAMKRIYDFEQQHEKGLE